MISGPRSLFPLLLALVSMVGCDQSRAAGSSESKGVWLRGDLHAHSSHSGDSRVPLELVIKAAEAAGLDFFAVTEQNKDRHWQDGSFRSSGMTLLYGIEWTMNQGVSGTGHASIISNLPFDWPLIRPTLGDFALKEHNSADARRAFEIARGMSNLKREILISINHPDKPAWKFLPEASVDVDSVEVWNGPWTARDHKALTEFYHDHITRGRRLAVVSGSDSHDARGIGNPTLWVYAASRDGRDIIRAIKAGRTFISKGPDGPQIRLHADVTNKGVNTTGAGAYPLMMGDSLPSALFGRQVIFRVEVQGANRINPARNSAVLTLFKNGRVLAAERFSESSVVREFRDEPRAGDYYRAELRFLNLNSRARPEEQNTAKGVVALTNPIYTERPTPP